MFLRFALLVALSGASLALAQHEAGAKPQAAGAKPHEAAAAHEEHHRHHVSFFLGGSHHEGEYGVTYGGEYALRFHRRVSIGAEIEHAGGDFRDEVFTFPLIFDIYRGLKFATGPGFEREVREIRLPDGETEREKERAFLYRIGLHYEIPVKKRFSVTPNIAFDITAHRTVFVYGVSFGFGF